MSTPTTAPALGHRPAAAPAEDSNALSRPLAAWAGAIALLGWALMSLGAFVRASESGLGCPDWPACHGKLVSSGHHAMIEELHRWLAAAVILGTIGLAVAIFRFHRADRRLRRSIILVLALLALQAALGGVTVILRNVSWTVVAHYGTAALFVASITSVAVRLALPARPAMHDSFSRLVSWFAGLSFGLLVLGSTVANTDSHIACGQGFPLCNGSLLPNLDHHVLLNMTHRAWAGIMLMLALWVLIRSRREQMGKPAIRRAAATVALLYLAQAGLGIAVVGLGENTALDVAHSSLGSLTWLAITALFSLTPRLEIVHQRDTEMADAISPRCSSAGAATLESTPSRRL